MTMARNKKHTDDEIDPDRVYTHWHDKERTRKYGDGLGACFSLTAPWIFHDDMDDGNASG